MPSLNHVRRAASHNVVSAAIPDETFERLEARCAKLGVPRSLVIRDFIQFCLDICDGAEVVDEIKAAMKGTMINAK
jgi:hypothetical protein